MGGGGAVCSKCERSFQPDSLARHVGSCPGPTPASRRKTAPTAAAAAAAQAKAKAKEALAAAAADAGSSADKERSTSGTFDVGRRPSPCAARSEPFILRSHRHDATSRGGY
jgi:hypothetical protein